MYEQRPTGVTLIAVLFFIAGAISLLGGLLVLAAPIPSIAELAGTGALVTFQIAIALLAVLVGGFDIAIGWGLWNLRSWARIASIVMLGLSAISNLFSGVASLVGVNTPFGRFNLAGYGVFSLLVAGFVAWMIWYLLQPDIDRMFAGGGSMFQMPQTVQAPAPELSSQPQVDLKEPPASSIRPPRQHTMPMYVQPPAEGWLVLRSGSRAGQQFGLQRGKNTVGRDPTRADILLENETVSGEHARVQYEHGQFYVYDLASRNGTFVNNRSVQKHLLMDGDLLRFGTESLVFKRI